MNNNNELFKDKFCKYSGKDGKNGRIIEDFVGLNDAINKNLEHRLDVLLSGCQIEDLIKEQAEFSSSERGNHGNKTCNSVKRMTEHEICKCMYFYNRKEKFDDNICRTCFIKQQKQQWKNISKQFVVIDYEFPMPYKHRIKNVRNVDLVIEDKNSGDYYAVEVKPPQGNKETISRMMAETLTYTAILESAGDFGKKNEKRLQPAIAFFKGSIQWNKFDEYKKLNNPDFENLLKEIKVFEIKKNNKDGKCLFEFHALN